MDLNAAWYSATGASPFKVKVPVRTFQIPAILIVLAKDKVSPAVKPLEIRMTAPLKLALSTSVTTKPEPKPLGVDCSV